MSLVRFSSNVLVDDGTVPVQRFAAFELQVANAQALESLRDEAAWRYGLSFVGSGLRDAKAVIDSIAVPRLANGEPDVTLDGVAVAGALGQGELVTISFGLYSRANPEAPLEVIKSGVITNVVWSATQGPMGQRLDLVFHVCHRLVVMAGGAAIVFTDPGVV